MQFTPYLGFNGQCREAFQFYEKLLGGKIEFIMTYGEMPAPGGAPPEWGSKIMHASLRVGDTTLQGSDAPPAQMGGYQAPQGINVAMHLTDAAEAERIFKGLSEGGKVRMPMAETFWAVRFGMVTDRYGIPWMINCGKPM